MRLTFLAKPCASGSCRWIWVFLLAFSSGNLVAQRSISGQVIDQEQDYGIPGATVIIKGTDRGTITDVEGNFQIDAREGDVLAVSFVGFVTEEISVGTETNISVAMRLDVKSLDEVVVVGYGQTQNKATVSTSVHTVSSKVIEDRPISRVEQAIQGSMPAVVVVKESGSPGAPLTIRMRGVGTAGNSSPLVLVNGVQVPDMNFLNPNDIRNITVLRDAASAAIYGARGGNGVILLETKKAKTRKEPEISFGSYYGVQSLASEGEYLNSSEYAEYYNNSIDYLIREGLPTTGGRGKFSDEEIADLPQTSWIDAISEEATIQDHYLRASGGNDQLSYFISGGLFDQEGIIGKTSFNRKSVMADISTKLKPNLELRFNSSYSSSTRQFIAENSENSRLLSSVASLPPIFPVYDENGIPFNNGIRTGVIHNGVTLNPQAEFGNPVVGLTTSENEAVTNILFANSLLKWKVLENLSVNTSFGYGENNSTARWFSGRFNWPSQQFVNPQNFLTENTLEELYTQWEGYVSYTPSIGANQNLTLLGGSSILRNESFLSGRTGIDFFPNTLDEVNFSNIVDNSTEGVLNDAAQVNTTLSYYGRLNYEFNAKYLFTATVRADGSSKFSDNHRWGVFPSFSAGWVISEEPFLAGGSTIDLLKIRGSWGVNGNDRIAPYQSDDRYFRDGSGGLFQLDFNENVKWEEISQTNFGVDANLLGNRIGITLDYYVKTTTDMLLNFANPSFLGLPPPVRNAAEVRNTGFEALLLYRDQIGDDFSFDISGNIGFIDNEVMDLGGGLPIEGAGTRVFQGAPSLTLTDVGGSIASFYGFKFEGLDEQGNPVYADLNDDGEITPDQDRTIIGNPFPDFIYGLNVKANYKNFDLTVFWSGSEGNDVVNASMGYGFQYSNRTRRVLDAWSLENQSSDVMRPSALEVVNHEFSDYYIEDGSYLRLRNLTLGYTLPKSWLNTLKVTKLRFYASANNILTITDYSGYDPEIGANNDPLDVGIDRGFYPLPKSFTGGLQLTF